MNAALIAEIMLSLAAAARVPSIGQGSVAAWLDLAGRLVKSGDKAESALQALAEQIETMVEQGREPTAEEWAALRVRSDAAHDEVQDWRPDGG